jgi:hypothetical protein
MCVYAMLSLLCIYVCMHVCMCVCIYIYNIRGDKPVRGVFCYQNTRTHPLYNVISTRARVFRRISHRVACFRINYESCDDGCSHNFHTAPVLLIQGMAGFEGWSRERAADKWQEKDHENVWLDGASRCHSRQAAGSWDLGLTAVYRYYMIPCS